jgi:hypothetical protein
MTAGSMEMIDSSVKSNYAGEADGGVFISGMLGCCNAMRPNTSSHPWPPSVTSETSRMCAMESFFRCHQRAQEFEELHSARRD